MSRAKCKVRGITIPVLGFSEERVKRIEDLPGELWRSFHCEDLEYFVSSFGRIKSGERKIFDIPCEGRIRCRIYKPKILRGVMDKYGYVKICICHRFLFVHRLVCKSFYGESILEVNHKNGHKTDNRLFNLEYCTRSENQRHSYATGLNHSTEPSGECTRKAALANRKVKEEFEHDIYNLYSTGKYLQKDLAKIYNVDKTTISRIYRKIKKLHKTDNNI